MKASSELRIFMPRKFLLIASFAQQKEFKKNSTVFKQIN